MHPTVHIHIQQFIKPINLNLKNNCINKLKKRLEYQMGGFVHSFIHVLSIFFPSFLAKYLTHYLLTNFILYSQNSHRWHSTTSTSFAEDTACSRTQPVRTHQSRNASSAWWVSTTTADLVWYFWTKLLMFNCISPL